MQYLSHSMTILIMTIPINTAKEQVIPIAMKRTVPLPVVITREGKWFVASCPILDVATQGKTEKEVKENMDGLIDDYMEDVDTTKPASIPIFSKE